VVQALLGSTSEARFIRHAHTHLTPWFPYLPARPGYNKRLRHAGELFEHVIAHLARQCPSWSDDLWLVDSTLIADKGYRRASFESELNQAGITLIRPNLKSETLRPGGRYLKAFRQIIGSVNQTLKSQLDLERHGGRTKPDVCARILQRILALTAAIWHNETSQRDGPARSLTAYDH
jgi:hypothetical protein